MATWTSMVDFDTNQLARSQHIPTKFITNLEKPLSFAQAVTNSATIVVL